MPPVDVATQHNGLAQVQAYSQATNEAKETPAPESGKAAGRLVTCSAGLYGERGGSGQCASSVKGAINHLDRPHQPEGLYGTPLRHSQ
jgi:hypothetical protein